MFTYLIYPSAEGWRVQLQDEAQASLLSTFEAAEHRARWLASRASVRGHDSEILLLAADGALVGRWWAETYAPALAQDRELAA